MKLVKARKSQSTPRIPHQSASLTASPWGKPSQLHLLIAEENNCRVCAQAVDDASLARMPEKPMII